MSAITTSAKCGTYAGYQWHIRYGSETCQPRRDANADYNHTFRQSPEVRNAQREQSNAYHRAEARLREAHRREFERYYAEELGA